MIFYVYIYVDSENCPLYVGKGRENRDTRHLCPSTLENGTYWHNKLRKMRRLGQDYRIIRLFEGLNEEMAFTWERGLIAQFGRRDLGTGCLYNMTDGGEGAANGAAQRETLRRLHADPEFAAAHVERTRQRNADPEFAAANAERMRQRNADPEFAAAKAERGREQMRQHHANPEFAAAHSERMRKKHADPEFAAATVERGREQMRRRYADKRVAAHFEFGDLHYQIDLAKRFNIKPCTLAKRIKRGVSPYWACIYQGKKCFPDYCKPAKIQDTFSTASLNANSIALKWLADHASF